MRAKFKRLANALVHAAQVVTTIKEWKDIMMAALSLETTAFVLSETCAEWALAHAENCERLIANLTSQGYQATHEQGLASLIAKKNIALNNARRLKTLSY